MAPEQRPYRLASSELEALASGEYTEKIIEQLRSAEYSRNSLFAEALRRWASGALTRADRLLIESAIKLISNVHARSPRIAAQVLTSPHFGFWVAGCLIRLRNSAVHVRSTSADAREEIRYIAAFAAAAGIVAGHHFELT